MQLKLHELRLRKDDPVLVIEDSYEIMGEHKRSYYALISQCNQNHHHFVFQPENLENNHPWMDELNGLRETAYFCMRSVKNEIYEVHLKPTKEKTYFFGYIVKQDVFEKNMRDSVEELLHFRRLPLVLDLDDTLVRLVGEGNERFVPEADLPKCRDRVARLKDGRRIVLAERVQEFLDWAQNLFQISVCSLGDQEYVTNVVDVLDPLKTRIKGPIYSARHEHEYIRKSIDPSRPPKDLRALFTYCNLTDNSFGSGTSLPLILDDETRMWPADQHDNIIEVIGQPNSSVWSVALFPVVKDTLEHVHREFFRQYDQWCLRSNEAKTRGQIYTRPGPSAVVMYKTYLRHILRDMIGKSPVYRNAAPYA
ncbi:hypothetical protein BDF20DRAFT_827672 [Mycotypha africana]|uniref:uncharacterized protein n=1 Tax=Mycotypha africana TaxID=64632 RepID=UPI0023017683|nr:uncharacterized protein BDF20DRAFT_827672 [Mycotypha africana]KAI8968460.1 hypothetical protein BDF20DRAFT_827672 [Mycotypha africana]